MLLSIVIPCYNEHDTIDAIIDAVNNSSYKDKEIIVVDDCSTDGTQEKLRQTIECSGRVAKVFYHGVNQGKGAALRTGFQRQLRETSSLFKMPILNMTQANIPPSSSRFSMVKLMWCLGRDLWEGSRIGWFIFGTRWVIGF